MKKFPLHYVIEEFLINLKINPLISNSPNSQRTLKTLLYSWWKKEKNPRSHIRSKLSVIEGRKICRKKNVD